MGGREVWPWGSPLVRTEVFPRSRSGWYMFFFEQRLGKEGREALPWSTTVHGRNGVGEIGGGPDLGKLSFDR
jgi:hypothetical protein